MHEPKNAIAVKLRDEHFDKLIVEVAEPDAKVTEIRQAVKGGSPA